LDTLELGLKIKKTPVVVGNCTGFAVNRVFFPYTMSACLLADLGVDIYMIDNVIKGMFGMPMGPFRLSDLVRLFDCKTQFADVLPEVQSAWCFLVCDHLLSSRAVCMFTDSLSIHHQLLGSTSIL
jgi:3-hydroxyacyl-CoA dehydrogenase